MKRVKILTGTPKETEETINGFINALGDKITKITYLDSSDQHGLLITAILEINE